MISESCTNLKLTNIPLRLVYETQAYLRPFSHNTQRWRQTTDRQSDLCTVPKVEQCYITWNFVVLSVVLFVVLSDRCCFIFYVVLSIFRTTSYDGSPSLSWSSYLIRFAKPRSVFQELIQSSETGLFDSVHYAIQYGRLLLLLLTVLFVVCLSTSHLGTMSYRIEKTRAIWKKTEVSVAERE